MGLFSVSHASHVRQRHGLVVGTVALIANKSANKVMQRFAGYWVPVEGWPLSVSAKKNDSESHDQPRHVASFIQFGTHVAEKPSQVKPLFSGALTDEGFPWYQSF